MNKMPLIGQAIRYYRKRKGWTKKELADAAGLSESYISLLESGERGEKISFTKLNQLAAALGKTAQELADWRPEGDSQSWLKQIAELWRELSDHEQWDLLEQAESAAERRRKRKKAR